jgi:hypothetical protein
MTDAFKRTWPIDGRCAVCGRPDDDRSNPLISDDFYDGTFQHLRCLNSPAGRAWHLERRAIDATFDRYCRLLTIREPIVCSDCGTAMEMTPKGVGMGASAWVAACCACHRTGAATISPYDEGDVWRLLNGIMRDFTRARRLKEIKGRVLKAARLYDSLVNRKACDCGGRFSVAAKPRCLGCDGIVIDTWFHVFEEPLSEERRRRVEEFWSRSF